MTAKEAAALIIVLGWVATMVIGVVVVAHFIAKFW